MPERPPLREYSRSRAVVMGTSEYSFLPNLPAALNSLDRMIGLLTGPLCGWPADRVTLLANEPGPGDLPDRLITSFEDVDDVALFYYVGHGQIDLANQLCLGLVGSRTEANRRAVTSLPFEAIRRAMLDSQAATKIVILDCCFAGLASLPANSLAASSDDVLDRTAGSGAYTMAASAAYSPAWYDTTPDAVRPQTFFTQYLVDLVEGGIPGQPSGLRLHPLFVRLRDRLASDRRPAPVERSVDAARNFVFAHNAAPLEVQRDLDREVTELSQRLAQAEARRAVAEAAREQARFLAEARERALRAEIAERTRELERLQEHAQSSPAMPAEERQELDEAIDEAQRLLDKTATAHVVAEAADSGVLTLQAEVESLKLQASRADAVRERHEVHEAADTAERLPEDAVTETAAWTGSPASPSAIPREATRQASGGAPDIRTAPQEAHVLPEDSAIMQAAVHSASATLDSEVISTPVTAAPDRGSAFGRPNRSVTGRRRTGYWRDWPGELATAVLMGTRSTVAAIVGHGSERGGDSGARRGERRWPVVASVLALLVLLLGGGAYGAWWYNQRQYYVGVQDGNVAIFRGTNQSLAGINLSSLLTRSILPVSQLGTIDQGTLANTISKSSLTDAESLINMLQTEVNLCHAQWTALANWQTKDVKYQNERARAHASKAEVKPTVPPADNPGPLPPTPEAADCAPSTAFGIRAGQLP